MAFTGVPVDIICLRSCHCHALTVSADIIRPFLSLFLVETSPVLDHNRCGRHNHRGVSTGCGTAADAATHIRCGCGVFECGDAPAAVAATPVVVEDWGRLYEKQHKLANCRLDALHTDQDSSDLARSFSRDKRFRSRNPSVLIRAVPTSSSPLCCCASRESQSLRTDQGSSDGGYYFSREPDMIKESQSLRTDQGSSD